MNIKFVNGANFEYVNAFALENDYHKGIKRPSLDIHFPVETVTYTELEEILSDVTNLKEIVLTGDEQTYPVYANELDENGNVISTVIDHYETVPAPQNTYVGYDIQGKITIDDETITVKLFKKSDLELENEEAMATIDELLIAMEV